jgi:hypothetical protein
MRVKSNRPRATLTIMTPLATDPGLRDLERVSFTAAVDRLISAA